MTTLTATELFGESGAPLRVREFSLYAASEPVTAEAVKVVFTLGGYGELRSGEESAPMGCGSIFTVPPSQRCYAVPVGHTRAVAFYLHPEYLNEQLRWLPSAHPLVHQLRRTVDGMLRVQHLHIAPAAMQGLIPRLTRLAHMPRRDDQELTRLTLAGTVFDAVGKLAGRNHPDIHGGLPNLAAPCPAVAAAIALMQQQIDQVWRVEDLARRVAISSSQLARLFRSQVGISPTEYLRQLRADRMAELLATTSMSVNEAARAVGWCEPSVASRAFRRRYGASPRQFAESQSDVLQVGALPHPLVER